MKTFFVEPFSELSQALLRFSKWYKLAAFMIKRRYYTTGLGPIWVLLTNFLFIVGICFLYAGAFNLRFQEYLAHLGLGYLIWNLISDTFGSGANIFVSEYGIFSQLKVNLLGLVIKGVIARCMIFAYNIPLILMIFYSVGTVNSVVITSVFGLFAIIINSFFASYTLSVLSARFRDIPHIIMTITRFAFFFTPILWEADAVGTGVRSFIVKLNPFYHFIEIVRQPINNQLIPSHSWLFVLACTVLNVLVFCLIYKLAHKNIVLYSA